MRLFLYINTANTQILICRSIVVWRSKYIFVLKKICKTLKMTSSHAFSKLVLIFIINLFVQLHTADAGGVPSAQSAQDDVIKNFLFSVCTNVNENKPKLCSGVPSSAKDVCSNIVNKGCEVMGTEQPDWRPLVPFCKENLSKVVCGDFLTALESAVGKEPDTVANNPTETATLSWLDKFADGYAKAMRNPIPLPFGG